MTELSLADIRSAIELVSKYEPTAYFTVVPRWWVEQWEQAIQQEIEENPHILISDTIEVDRA